MAVDRPWARAGVEIFGMFALVIGAVIFYPLLGVVGMIWALAI